MPSFHPTRREIFEIYQEKKHAPILHKIDHVTSTVLNGLKFSEQDRKSAEEDIRRLCYEFKRRTASKKNLANPKCNFSDWLDESIHFKEPVPGPGRPQVPFQDLSLSSKRRRVDNLCKSASTVELAFATEMSARADGNEDAAKLLHTMFQSDNTDVASKIRAAFLNDQKSEKLKVFEAEEALALYINLDLSQDGYQRLRNEMEGRHAKGLLPAYRKVQDAGDACCPPRDSMVVTESSVKISLQSLLDLTVGRLLKKYGDALHDGVSENSGDEKTVIQICLVSKWGFDGSSGHARYKQITTGDYNDGSIFLTCLVPLKLYIVATEKSETVLWLNPAPSSTRFCRLVSFEFVKETQALSAAYYKEMEQNVAALVPTTTEWGNVTVITKHELHPCMVDGKVCSAIAGTSSSRCHICGAYPVNMNDLEKVKLRSISKETFKFGVSPLHFRIRSLEAVLHIAYKLDNKKWAAKSASEKASVEERKQIIQEMFLNSTGLYVDFVKQGHGTTNDGNTARRFFDKPEISAEITGVSLDLISRLGLISKVLCCGRKLNLCEFKRYCYETAEVFVREYPWYYMPQSLHKVLIHGADILAEFPLPAGVFTEEAQEARNKDLRKAREEHARKTSRIDTNVDVARRFMITSDPIVSSYMAPRDAPTEPTEEMAALLL